MAGSSSTPALRRALDAFTETCSGCSGIYPDPSFSAWADDSLLPGGVAINPQAAAQCVQDYQRSVVFIRAVYAAISALKLHHSSGPIEILYAGCGPFATLLLPLLGKFLPGELSITLLDIHRRSLDSVEQLVDHFGFAPHAIKTVRGDACLYQHPVKLDLVIAETMQKALEQEPQVAVTGNLAAQLAPRGIFIPQLIEVSLSLADLKKEAVFYSAKSAVRPGFLRDRPRRLAIASLARLSVCSEINRRCALHRNEAPSTFELLSSTVEVPAMDEPGLLNAVLYTRVVAFEGFCLEDYQSEITLPLRCYELEPLRGGDRYSVSYPLGNYPKFHFERLPAAR